MFFEKKNYIQLTGELFNDVQIQKIFGDSKTFVDSVPKENPPGIIDQYKSQKGKPGFDLREFVAEKFFLPEDEEIQLNLPKNRSMEEHISFLWDYLVRTPQAVNEYSTLVPLIDEYIIPGGRFREIYYWDSYFTMLGLYASSGFGLIKKMVENFSYLLENLGFIPNGNRVYYLSRSQPPFYSLMIELLLKVSNGVGSNLIYASLLEKEYNFWMKYANEVLENKKEHLHVVGKGKAGLLNRYYDSENIPREESFFEDFNQFSKNKKRKNFYRDMRAAAESGWDFSSRWFEDGKNLSTIKTTDILPVELNCLLANCERLLARMYNTAEHKLKNEIYKERFELRLGLIRDLFWSKEENFFFDLNFKKKKLSKIYSLAGMFPLYFGFAESHQAEKAAYIIENIFLKEGGLLTTPYHTSQQWDAPNGWAPLQWISIIGLRNYGFHQLADKIKARWLRLNESVFEKTGRMFEKYNVENINLPGGGGEYPLQDGFGWTNGVAIALIKNLDLEFIQNVV